MFRTWQTLLTVLMHKSMLKTIALKTFRFLFARPFMAPINRVMYILSLKGLGVLNYETQEISGESWFLDRIGKGEPNFTALDIGANEGVYSAALKKVAPFSTVFALEPHPHTFSRLLLKLEGLDCKAFNLAVSDSSGELILFDYENSQGTSHASVYGNSITDLRNSRLEEIKTKAITIDDFVVEQEIKNLRLVKIDTEGHELKVLVGAKKSLDKKIIDIIHFEFNEMNVFSRTFMRDFFEVLPDFDFYRLLPQGLLPLNNYSALSCEIFLFQNIIAIRRGVKF